jgi:hypothetical protein
MQEEPVNARHALILATLLLASVPGEAQQPAESQSCAGELTEQLRRFNEQCLSDLVGFVASKPKATARVLGEKAKFYVQLTGGPNGLDAEAVSRANFPFMTPDTGEALKSLGWAPPENEQGNYRKHYGTGDPARTAEDIAKTLAAYGLAKGEAISLSVSVQN